MTVAGDQYRSTSRKAGVIPANRQVATGQLFTKHVIPSYIVCREGEQLLDDTTSFSDISMAHQVASVERDLQHLHRQLRSERLLGTVQPQSETVQIADRPKAVLGMMEVYYI